MMVKHSTAVLGNISNLDFISTYFLNIQRLYWTQKEIIYQTVKWQFFFKCQYYLYIHVHTHVQKMCLCSEKWKELWHCKWAVHENLSY